MAKRVPIVCHGHSRPIVSIDWSQNTPEGERGRRLARFVGDRI